MAFFDYVVLGIEFVDGNEIWGCRFDFMFYLMYVIFMFDFVELFCFVLLNIIWVFWILWRGDFKE